MSKFYIATSLKRMKEHNLVRDHLIQNGHEITYDWTFHGSQKYTSLERLAEIGKLQKQAVKHADVVVVLLPGGKGTHAELGMALGFGKPILLHSETSTSFALGEEICSFYCCSGVTQLVNLLPDVLNEIELFVQNPYSEIINL